VILICDDAVLVWFDRFVVEFVWFGMYVPVPVPELS
jgi:hypothetical protein